jgi:hypothetical protein
MRAALRAKVGIGLLVLGVSLSVSMEKAMPVAAQQSADQVVLDLNHGAMDSYNNMDINKAGSMLEEALRVATEGGVTGPLLAQTNMNLAIVYIGGLGDNDSGVRYFADALCADPSSQLDPLTSTPDIQSVFQVAAQRVQQTGCPGQQGQQGPPVQGQPNLAPGMAAQTMPMAGPQQGGAPPPNMDGELPPGWAASTEGDGKAKDFKRGFFQVGLTLGLPYISNGMLADRPPPDSRVFIDRRNGGQIVDPTTANANDLRFPGTKLGVPDQATGQDVGIEQANAWVPDADSADGYTGAGGAFDYQALGGSCPADGVATGPRRSATDMRDLFPSRYCVRVKSPGFAPQLALRAALGYFVTQRVSLALITRFQFGAGEGTFAHLLLGARAEYMFTKVKARGLMLSGFLGGTFGQIQAQPSADKPTGGEPWIKSGLQGANIGANIRYRFTNNLGIYFAPELDFQLPTFLWNIDLTFLGAEVSF